MNVKSFTDIFDEFVKYKDELVVCGEGDDETSTEEKYLAYKNIFGNNMHKFLDEINISDFVFFLLNTYLKEAVSDTIVDLIKFFDCYGQLCLYYNEQSYITNWYDTVIRKDFLKHNDIRMEDQVSSFMILWNVPSFNVIIHQFTNDNPTIPCVYLEQMLPSKEVDNKYDKDIFKKYDTECNQLKTKFEYATFIGGLEVYNNTFAFNYYINYFYNIIDSNYEKYDFKMPTRKEDEQLYINEKGVKIYDYSDEEIKKFKTFDEKAFIDVGDQFLLPYEIVKSDIEDKYILNKIKRINEIGYEYHANCKDYKRYLDTIGEEMDTDLFETLKMFEQNVVMTNIVNFGDDPVCDQIINEFDHINGNERTEDDDDDDDELLINQDDDDDDDDDDDTDDDDDDADDNDDDNNDDDNNDDGDDGDDGDDDDGDDDDDDDDDDDGDNNDDNDDTSDEDY